MHQTAGFEIGQSKSHLKFC